MFRKAIDMTCIVPTSKMSLKLSCLAACNNDIAQAERLYKFMSEGLEHLPDMEPERVSGFQQVKASATEIFEWIGSHKEDIMQGVQMIQSIRGSSSVSSVAPLDGIEPIPPVK